MKSALLIFGMLTAAVFAGTVSDSNLGYSIALPSNWVQLKSKPDQHYFRDSTRHYRGQISILKYDIDKASYPTPENWSQAQFIAYKLSVETSVFPFGAVEYYDSSSAAKLGPNWAPEAFSVLYPGDGDPTYCEFIRYCAVGNVGYEIYAIGDSTDMIQNVDFYASVIASLQFTTPIASIAHFSDPIRHGIGIADPKGFFDLVGRELPEGPFSRATHAIAGQRLISKPTR
ncbi:MAG: hypothetical protein JWO30_1894 [Fibrobacteres bacterium]|nr:hypothetical protein [Fibrobacterota bacterium]